jgi:hypothetical protein
MMPKYDNVDPELSHIELKKADAAFCAEDLFGGSDVLTTIAFNLAHTHRTLWLGSAPS